jgi:putative FmdB family regulatory protein
MPTYDYGCAACGARFEVTHAITADGPSSCPTCGGGPVKKAFAPPAILFKGAGWAKVDRRTAARPAAASSGDASSTSDGAASGGAASASSGEAAGAASGGSGDAAAAPTPAAD